MGGIVHLSRRFFGSLRPGGPSSADQQWVRRHLTGPEAELWERMSNPDQRHAVGVARAVDNVVTAGDTTEEMDDRIGLDGWFETSVDRGNGMVAAALLHDCGKVVSQLGTFTRVGATIVRPMIGPETVRGWLDRPGLRRRLAQYWRHPELGHELLTKAKSHRFVATWALEHHRPTERWSLPIELGMILRDCDDD